LTALQGQLRICYLKKLNILRKNGIYLLLPAVIQQSNNTIHDSTKFKPIDAIKDSDTPEAKTNLVLRSRFKRKYKEINVGDFSRILKRKENIAR